MKKALKSYLVFTSCLYRLVMFAVLPAAWLGVCLCICGNLGSRVGNGVLMVTALFLPMAETVSDGWLFAGMQTSGQTQLDYLKTSGRGKGIMRRALIMDMLRKLIFSAGIFGLVYGVLRLLGLLSGKGGDFALGGSEPWGALWCLIMLSFFFSVLGTFLSRYGNMLWINIMVGYGVATLEIGSLFLPGLFLHPYVYGTVFGLLGLAVSGVAVMAAVGRMERSYYDA